MSCSRAHLGPPARLPRARSPRRSARRAEGLDLVWDRQPLEGFESAPDRRSRRALRSRGDGPPARRRGGGGGLLPPARHRVRPRLPRRPRPGRRRARLHLLRLRRPPLGAAARRGDPGDGPAPRSRRRRRPQPGTPSRISRARRPDGAVARRAARGAQPLLHRRGARRAAGLAATPTASCRTTGGRAALDLLRRLHALRAPAADGLNPIGILEAMARGDDLAFCPLVYGYVNYARAEDGRRAIRFADAPSAQPGGRPGSTLGGTGIAISTRCAPTPALVAHLRMADGARNAGRVHSRRGRPAGPAERLGRRGGERRLGRLLRRHAAHAFRQPGCGRAIRATSPSRPRPRR